MICRWSKYNRNRKPSIQTQISSIDTSNLKTYWILSICGVFRTFLAMKFEFEIGWRALCLSALLSRQLVLAPTQNKSLWKSNGNRVFVIITGLVVSCRDHTSDLGGSNRLSPFWPLVKKGKRRRRRRATSASAATASASSEASAFAVIAALASRTTTTPSLKGLYWFCWILY